MFVLVLYLHLQFVGSFLGVSIEGWIEDGMMEELT